jgi:hypothetical protein
VGSEDTPVAGVEDEQPGVAGAGRLVLEQVGRGAHGVVELPRVDHGRRDVQRLARPVGEGRRADGAAQHRPAACVPASGEGPGGAGDVGDHGRRHREAARLGCGELDRQQRRMQDVTGVVEPRWFAGGEQPAEAGVGLLVRPSSLREGEVGGQPVRVGPALVDAGEQIGPHPAVQGVTLHAQGDAPPAGDCGVEVGFELHALREVGGVDPDHAGIELGQRHHEVVGAEIVPVGEDQHVAGHERSQLPYWSCG